MISISFPWPRSILWQVWALAFPRPDEAETETCCDIRDKFDVITDDGHDRMWPKQLLGPCGATPKACHLQFNHSAKRYVFPLGRDIDTAAKWNARES